MFAILGKKVFMTQIPERYRVYPATVVDISDVVVALKKELPDVGKVVVVGYGKKKHPIKSELGEFKDLGYVPQYKTQVKVTDELFDKLKIGKISEDLLKELLKKDSIVDVTGISKGKGFAGVIKRWGFSRQPKTHGQSDRERHPGSIGAQTPGRVFKGKKMAGKMGNKQVTIKNVKVLGFISESDKQLLLLKGGLPGAYGKIVTVKILNTNMDKK